MFWGDAIVAIGGLSVAGYCIRELYNVHKENKILERGKSAVPAYDKDYIRRALVILAEQEEKINELYESRKLFAQKLLELRDAATGGYSVGVMRATLEEIEERVSKLERA